MGVGLVIVQLGLGSGLGLGHEPLGVGLVIVLEGAAVGDTVAAVEDGLQLGDPHLGVIREKISDDLGVTQSTCRGNLA